MTVGLERTLLERHLRLLLGKLGESNHSPGREGGLLCCVARLRCTHGDLREYEGKNHARAGRHM